MVTEETAEFIVVERINYKKGHMPREVLHLAEAGAIEPSTLCGYSFDHRTMIPLSSWGKPDREWCGKCARVKLARESCGRAEIDSSEKDPEE